LSENVNKDRREIHLSLGKNLTVADGEWKTIVLKNVALRAALDEQRKRVKTDN